MEAYQGHAAWTPLDPDTTIVRTHHSMPPVPGVKKDQVLGHSRGGLSTKFILSGTAEVVRLGRKLRGDRFTTRDMTVNFLRDQIKEQGSTRVIPKKSSIRERIRISIHFFINSHYFHT